MSNSDKPYLIVVGVDYSPASDLALERAFELGAERAQAEVHVVNVVRLYGAQALVDGPAELAGFAAMSLSEATAQLGTYVDKRWSAFLAKGKQHPTGAGRVLTHLRLEAPAEELAQIAGDLEADLLVVGTHSRTGIARLLLGSVAESVVKLAPCPVLVVRGKPQQPDDAPHIEPPCPQCVETRRSTKGEQYWCEQHREKHGQRRHTYHQDDRAGAETEMPLTYHN